MESRRAIAAVALAFADARKIVDSPDTLKGTTVFGSCDDSDREARVWRGGEAGRPRGPGERAARPGAAGRGVREAVRGVRRSRPRDRGEQRDERAPRRPPRPRNRARPRGRRPAPHVLRLRVHRDCVRRHADVRRRGPGPVHARPRTPEAGAHEEDPRGDARPPLRADRGDGPDQRARGGPRHPRARGRVPGPRRGVPRPEGGEPRGYRLLLVLPHEEHDDGRGRDDRHGRPSCRGGVPPPEGPRPGREVRARPGRVQPPDDGDRGGNRARAAPKARRLRAEAAGERGPPHEGDLADRGPRAARRGELDAPRLLPVRRAGRGRLPAVAGRDRPAAERAGDRMPALVPDRAVPAEGVREAAEGPLQGRGGGPPEALRDPRAPARVLGGHRGDLGGSGFPPLMAHGLDNLSMSSSTPCPMRIVRTEVSETEYALLEAYAKSHKMATEEAIRRAIRNLTLPDTVDPKAPIFQAFPLTRKKGRYSDASDRHDFYLYGWDK